MILIKRRCKFFNSCHYVSINSKTCTENAGGDYCGVFRTLSELQKEKEKKENDNKERRSDEK